MTINQHSVLRHWLLAFFAVTLVLVSQHSTSAQQWTTNGNNISNTNSGNVGIGTTNPSSTLNIKGAGPQLIVEPTSASNLGRIAVINDIGSFTAFNGYGSTYSGTIAGINKANLSLVFGAGSSGLMMHSGAGGPAPLYLVVNEASAVPAVTINTSGNVGIGTTSPGSKLHVNSANTTTQAVMAVSDSAGAAGNFAYLWSGWSGGTPNAPAVVWGLSNDLRFGTGTTDFLGTGFSEKLRITSSGNVGIGTASPDTWAKLHIYNAAGAGVDIQSANTAGFSRLRFVTGTHAYGWFAGDSSQADAPNKIGLYDYTVGAFRMMIDSSGNVGIGTSSPAYKLDVAGNINSSATITGNNIVAKYQDVAEWVPSAEQLPAGTVVVLDSTKSNQVISSSVSYDTRVAGVISEQPGIALGEKSDNKVLVATTGRVRVKVDASRAPIHIGDLLVTSDIPGVAMKSERVNIGGVQIHRPGTIIGKALEPLEKESGTVLVLLSLQ
jgi:hypothetical protein